MKKAKKTILAVMIAIASLFAVNKANAQESGQWNFERHNNLSFECTFHHINVGNGEFLILDVIRGQKNTIRFFHANTAGLHQYKLDEGEFKLAQDENRITGQSDELNFDLQFDVEQSGVPVPVVNPFDMFNIVAFDHPSSKYEGWVTFQGQTWTLDKSTSFGTISQHFGRELPQYFYYNVLPENAGDAHFVGSFALVSTSLGAKIDSYYLLETSNGKSNLLTMYNSIQTIERNGDGQWEITIKALDHNFNNKITLNASPDANNNLPHDIVDEKSVTYFGSTLYSEKDQRLFPAIVEWRNYNQDRFINNNSGVQSGGGNVDVDSDKTNQTGDTETN